MDAILNRRTLRMCWVVFVLFMGLLTVSAQSVATPPVAAVTGGQLTLYGLNGGAQTVTSGSISNLVWSGDGQHLALTVWNGQSTLMRTDRHGSAPVTVAQSVSYFPATFSADSSRILYAVDGSSDETTNVNGVPQLPVRIYSQDVNGGEATVIGEFLFGIGCGGGSPFPMDMVYNTETGFSGRALTFAHTDAGILYSANCAGIGLGLFNTSTGESSLLSGDATRAALSPNGSQVAAIINGSIAVFNLASGGQQTISTGYAADQIGWRDNSMLVYSARHLMDSPLPLSTEEAQALANRYGMSSDDVPRYNVSIHQLSLSGGETQLYRGPGWAVGRMFVSQGTLYFSLVPNGEAWVEALATGQNEWNAVTVTLFQLTGSALEAGSDVGQATPHPTS
jgi:hypothetical protein